MRTMTARERAEAQVACIRQAWPNPQKSSEWEGVPNSYCVFIAARNYDAALIKVPMPMKFYDKIVSYNDMGLFQRAWNVLTDYYEEIYRKQENLS